MKKRMASLVLCLTLLASTVFISAPGAVAADATYLDSDSINIAPFKQINDHLVVGTMPDNVYISDARINSDESNRSSIVSFVSDDGHENDYLYRNVFASRGASCTVPVVEDYLSGRSGSTHVSLDSLLKLQNDYGYEIASHSYDHIHLGELTDTTEITNQLQKSYDNLNNLGLDVKNFFAPFGSYTDDVLDLAQGIYRATRTSDLGFNSMSKNEIDLRNLHCYWLDSGSLTVEGAKEYINTAANDEDYLIFGFHSTVADDNFMNNTVGALIDYAQSKTNMQVLTVDKALDRIMNECTQDKDYFVGDNQEIVLDKYFLRSLPNGKNTMTFSFSNGTVKTLTINAGVQGGATGNFTADDAIVSIEIVSQPTKLIYIKNQSIDTTGLVVKGTMKNGNEVTLKNSSLKITANTSEVGSTTVSVGYEKLSTAFDITVYDAPKSIEIWKNPTTTRYIQGSPLDTTGMEVYQIFSDGESQLLNSSEYTVTGYDANKLGSQTLTVTYLNLTTTFNVTVSAPILTGIEITALPTSTQYEIKDGEVSVNTSGMIVSALYSNGTKVQLSSGYIVLDDYAVTEGEHTLTVYYSGYETTFNAVFFKQGASSVPTASNSTATEASESTGSPGSSGTTDPSSTDPTSPTNPGTTDPTESTAATTPTNTSDTIAALVMTSAPTKITYNAGEAIDLSGAVIVAVFKDGTMGYISASDCTVKGSTNNNGKQTIVLTYQGASVSYDITVIGGNEPVTSGDYELQIRTLPAKTTYNVGDSINITGLEVIMLNKSNGDTSLVRAYQLGGYDMNVAGTQFVEVTYNGLTAYFQITIKPLTVSAIEISHLPTKTRYVQGDELDLSGLVVDAVYNNGSTGEITEYTVSGFDTWKKGVQEITVSYEGKTTTFSVSVLAPTMTGIEITTPPNNTTYLLEYGEAQIDTTGMVVSALYSNGTKAAVVGYTIMDNYTATEGEHDITVYYSGFEATFKAVFYKEGSLSPAEKPLAPTAYGVTNTSVTLNTVDGCEYSIDGVNFQNSPVFSELTPSTTYTFYQRAALTTQNLASAVSDGLTITTLSSTDPIDPTDPSNPTIPTNPPVTDKVATTLVLVTAPTKTDYLQYEDIDISGLVLFAVYSDGTFGYVTPEECTVSGDAETLGDCQITVSNGGMSVSYDIHVKEAPIVLKSIKVNTLPNKVDYFTDEKVSYEGLTISKVFNNRTEEPLEDGYLISTVDTSTVGTKTVTVSYTENDVTYTTAFDISVTKEPTKELQILTLPNKLTYEVGDEFSLAGITVVLHDKETSTDTTVRNYSISGYDMNKVGNQTVTITYETFSASFDITVNPTTLSSIEVTSLPTKTRYVQGESFDASGIEVHAVYSNGTNGIITDYTLSGFDSNVLGTQEITVEYQGKQAIFAVSVRAPQMTGIEITKLPNSTYYKIVNGEITIDTTGMVVSALYNNGTTSIVSGAYVEEDYSVTSGPHTLSVYYSGYYATFEAVFYSDGEKIPASQPYAPVVSAVNSYSITLVPNDGYEYSLDGESWQKSNVFTGLDEYTTYSLFQRVAESSQYYASVASEITFATTLRDNDEPVGLAGLEITSAPNKTEYNQGDSIDTTGLVVSLVFSDNSKIVLDNSLCTVTGNTLTPGKSNVTISYCGYSDDFTIDVKEVVSPYKLVLDSLPNKLNYYVGDDLILAGIAVMQYNTETGESQAVRNYTLSGYDMGKAGTQTVVVSYGTLFTTFDINVTEVKLSGVEIGSNPYTTRYIQGDDVDYAGLSVHAVFNNGTYETVTDYTVSGYNKNTIGTQTITVAYKEFTTEFTVTVVAPQITNIAVTTLPKNLYYEIVDGEVVVDTTGMVVTAYYNNNIKVVVSGFYIVEDYSITPGSHELVVYYKGYETTFTGYFYETGSKIPANTPSAPTVLSITSNTITLVDTTGYQYSKDGVNWQSSNVFKGLSPNTSYTLYQKVAESDSYYESPSSEGTKVKTASSSASEIKLQSIKIQTKPDKTTYNAGDAFDLTGLTVCAVYSNGTTAEISSSEYTVTGGSTSSPGEKTVVVSYYGFSTTFNIVVNEVESDYYLVVRKSPNQTKYYAGDEIILAGIEVVTINKKTEVATVIRGYSLSDYDMNKAGEQQVTVTYDGMVAYFKITVLPVELYTLELSNLPAKINYVQGESLDMTGFRMFAVYNNGTDEEVYNYTVSGFDSNVIGVQTVKVSYKGLSLSFDVTVKKAEITGMIVAQLPDSNYYAIENGEVVIDLTGLRVYALYNNGQKVLVEGAYIVDDYTITPGEHTLTITYAGYKHVYNAMFYVENAMIGDVNNDGEVDINDVTLLQKYLAGLSSVKITAANSDMNGDGAINILDVTCIQRIIANMSLS